MSSHDANSGDNPALPLRAAAKLERGEIIRWTQKAPSGIRLTKRDRVIVPFSLVYAALVALFEYVGIKGGDTFFAIFGVPFVLIAFHLLFTRWFLDAWSRSRAWYVVTDLAAYVVWVAPFAHTCRHAGIGLDGVSVVPDDPFGTSGSILFPRRSKVSDSFDDIDMSYSVSFRPVPAYGSDGDVFDAVADVANVAKLIELARVAALDADGKMPPMKTATT